MDVQATAAQMRVMTGPNRPTRGSVTAIKQMQFNYWRKQLTTAFIRDDRLAWVEADQELRSLLQKMNTKEDAEVADVPGAWSHQKQTAAYRVPAQPQLSAASNISYSIGPQI